MLTPADLEHIVTAMLEEGVPTGVLARVFDLDVGLIEAQKQKVRTRRYGTADMDEYLEQAQWDAIDHARRIIATGTPEQQSRATLTLLSKSITGNSRRVPDSVARAREEVLEDFGAMRGGEPVEPEDPGRFVVGAREDDGA